MKKTIVALILMGLLFILVSYGCNGSNDTSKNTDKKITKKEQRKAKIAQHLEATRKLLTVAQSGADENVHYVRLTPENNYADKLSDGLVFTRDFTSGPGTGKFISSDDKFEFTSGNCNELIAESDVSDTDDKKKVHWKKKIKKCQEQILECDWCARLKDDHSVSYSISFLSWTIKNKECVGDCEEHGNETAYIRVRNR